MVHIHIRTECIDMRHVLRGSLWYCMVLYGIVVKTCAPKWICRICGVTNHEVLSQRREALKKAADSDLWQTTCLMSYIFYMFLHVGAKPHVHPHPKNTQTQYRILVIRGAMKTLAVRRDFDWCFVGFRVLLRV